MYRDKTTDAHGSILWERMQQQSYSEQHSVTLTLVCSFEFRITCSVFLVYIESSASAASIPLFAAKLVYNSSEDRVSNIRGTPLEIGGGVATYFCRIAFLGGSYQELAGIPSHNY